MRTHASLYAVWPSEGYNRAVGGGMRWDAILQSGMMDERVFCSEQRFDSVAALFLEQWSL